MNRLLLLEDDLSLIDGLQYSLKKNGFDTEVARTVREAMTRLPEISRYDLLILDVTLPDGTGFDFCERVRKSGSLIPVIFLTASDEEVSVIRGLDCGGITIELLSSRAFQNGRPLELTGAEYRLLSLLLRNAGHVVTREVILNELWDDAGHFVDDNTLSVYVRRLREKVETDPSNPAHLITVRGFGYEWKEDNP